MKDYNIEIYNENNKPKTIYKRIINFINAYYYKIRSLIK